MNQSKTSIIETYVCRDLSLLHPSCRAAFEELAMDLHEHFIKNRINVHFRCFETYRNPQRQRYLFNQKPQVTKADAWQSAHNYGFAADFVPYVYKDGQYQWDWDDKYPWQFLKDRAKVYGLDVPITWDRGHVESPLWSKYLRGHLMHPSMIDLDAL